MSGLIEVVESGIGNSIQDVGRFGFRHMGITVSGSLDPYLARCANALVGNSPDDACLEIRAVGPTLAIKRGRIRVALAGEFSATLHRADGCSRPVPAWTSRSLDPGDVLETGFLPSGTAYLAVSGGIDSPLQLGSRSTYQRALIGGIEGKPIVTGNLLPCRALERRGCHEYQADSWRYTDAPIRVMLGPQDGHFKPESIEQFLGSNYAVTPQIDRMGMRLEGHALVHVTPAAADIVSDGVTPGAIQVPGNGQPIILLADCQTVGGYPKIATVITADLPRLAQMKPGQAVCFSVVNAAQAKQALLDRETQWKWWAYGISFGLPEASINRDLTGGWPRVDWD